MRTWVLGLAAVLGGCATGGGPTAPLETTRAEPRAGIPLPTPQGETSLVVRAVEPGAPGREFTGVPCTAESTWFGASFTAPARLLFPDYGASAPVVRVSCADGVRSGTAESRPEASWNRGLGGWPAVGISVGTGDVSGVGVGVGWWGGGTGAMGGVPVVRYPDLRIPLDVTG